MSFDLKIENGDISLSKDGRLKLVNGNSKLKQDIVKILLTNIGENKYHQEYGCLVGALKIGSTVDADFIKLDITESVENAIRNLMLLQKKQSTKQYVAPSEIITDILNVDVTRDTSDPRLYSISVSVLTQQLTKLDENIAIRII
jgi:hypothetical protein